jgi:integrase
MSVLRESHGRVSVREFGPLALKAVRTRMIQARHSRTYINDHVGRIKRMFRWGVENEFVPPGVLQGLQAVGGLKRGRSDARETEPVRPVANEIVDAIRGHVSKQVWAMIELQRLTGMRSGEVVSMRGRDLDMSGPLWLYTPSTHKTEHQGHLRAVELGPRAKEIVRPFLKADLQAYMFSPADAVANQQVQKRQNRKSKVQPSQRDRSKPNPIRKAHDRYTTNSYCRAIERGCEKTWPMPNSITGEVKSAREWRRTHQWHPHQLRHNYATRIRKEFGVEAARILLGHRSTAVTELYAEIDRGRVQEIVSKVG